jgi:hypothetical protein
MTGATAAMMLVSQSSAGVSAPVSVALSPSDSVTGYSNTGAAANITTGLVVATPIGGTPSYTYAWVQVGLSPYTWTITAPTAASTAFTCGSLGPGNTAETMFKVTVTDSLGHTDTATVSAFANNGLPYDPRVGRTRDGGGDLA